MRTNIDIDDDLMATAMQAGPYKTKKDAVEAGLKLLARQAAYREILKWEGKLRWEGDESIDWTAAPADAARPTVPIIEAAPSAAAPTLSVQEPAAEFRRGRR
jgi:antitoxin ParD1/3/4